MHKYCLSIHACLINCRTCGVAFVEALFLLPDIRDKSTAHVGGMLYTVSLHGGGCKPDMESFSKCHEQLRKGGCEFSTCRSTHTVTKAATMVNLNSVHGLIKAFHTYSFHQQKD